MHSACMHSHFRSVAVFLPLVSSFLLLKDFANVSAFLLKLVSSHSMTEGSHLPECSYYSLHMMTGKLGYGVEWHTQHTELTVLRSTHQTYPWQEKRSWHVSSVTKRWPLTGQSMIYTQILYTPGRAAPRKMLSGLSAISMTLPDTLQMCGLGYFLPREIAQNLSK